MVKRMIKGEGSISYIQSRRKWCGRVLDPTTGRYKSVFVDTQAEASNAIKEMKQQIKDGIKPQDANMTLKDFLLNEWLPSKRTLKERVYVN